MTHEQALAYLARIGCTEKAPTAAYLAELQYAHLITVPYENLDILRAVRISLDENDLFDKIVTRRRGGYCFELNCLFGGLLRALGYTVCDYAARYLRGEQGIPMRRHHVLRVGCEEGEFLADVGVGEPLPMQPVPYCTKEEFTDSWGATYFFREDPVLGHVLCEHYKGSTRDVIGFHEELWCRPDYETISWWCESHPDSIFNKTRICSVRRHPHTRITLSDTTFRSFTENGVEEVTLAEEEIPALLADSFKLDL